jgi:hypothetical protein
MSSYTIPCNLNYYIGLLMSKLNKIRLLTPKLPFRIKGIECTLPNYDSWYVLSLIGY